MREFGDGDRNESKLAGEEKIDGVTRREFLELGVAATLAAGAEKIAWAADTKGEVPRRTLGRASPPAPPSTAAWSAPRCG